MPHTHDYRPRFDDVDDQRIKDLAALYGVPNNVLIRMLVKQALAAHADTTSIQAVLNRPLKSR